MTKQERTVVIISWATRILLAGTLILSVYIQDWLHVLYAAIALYGIFIPDIIERKLQINLPSIFELASIIFIVGSLYLGEIQDFYIRFWWWDLMLHISSGVIIGFLGFSIVYALNREEGAALKMDPFFISMFSFCFSLSVAVLWEIVEFMIDELGGFNMQKTGITDTMGDLIVALVGALIVCMAGYIFLKQDPKIIKHFETYGKQRHAKN